MINKKYISKLLNIIYILIIGLFLLDVFTPFEIKSQMIKSFTYFGVIIFAPCILLWNLFNFKKMKWKIIPSILPSLILIATIIIGPTPILFSSGAWKTQKILYQNSHVNFKKVEFQMQDVGALGYNNRTVEVTYLTNLFMIIGPVKPDIDKQVEWIKINEEIDELGLEEW